MIKSLCVFIIITDGRRELWHPPTLVPRAIACHTRSITTSTHIVDDRA